MNIIDHILVRSRVLSSCHVNSTKASLEIGAELIASTTPKLDARELLDALLSRERLGSTALGNGIAIPHCRSENCTHPSAALMHLLNPSISMVSWSIFYLYGSSRKMKKRYI